MDGWIEWAGGECPLAADSAVEVKFRDGDIDGVARAGFWSLGGDDWWQHRGEYNDIIAYRVVQEPAN